VRGFFRGERFLFFVCFFNLCIPLRALEAPRQPAKNVLVLFSSFARDNTDLLKVIEPALRARVPGRITFYNAYLEYSRVKEKRYLESQAKTFRHTYDGVKFSLVIASNFEALHFAVQYRDKIFPGVPIVFVEVSAEDLKGQPAWPGVTGLTVPVGLRETIDLALRLQPDTESVAVIASDSKHWLAVAHSELLRHQDKVKEIDLDGPASSQMLEKVAALPPHTVVLFQPAPQVSQQPELGTFEILTAVAQQVPTYSAWPRLCLNYGCIGGAYPDVTKQYLWTADLAAQVLSGERPEDIPLAHNTDLQGTVDWRALRRWHIPESALPPGTLVLYREPTFWERDRRYILAAILVILAQALWIVALLWQRARKRKADAALKESEGRFQRMANTTPSLVWMCDGEGKVTYLNDTRIEFTGRDPSAGYDDVWTKYIHPDDIEAVLSANALGLERHEKFSKQYRLRRKDGDYRWMFDVAAPRVNGDGSFAGFIGSAADITDQKLAQEALEKVGGQLIEAQEKERSRIARDLHDDICQRLAILSVELEQAGRNGVSPSTKKKLEEIEQHCAEITTDIQSLSHQLHSSKLDYLGLVEGTRAFCDELSNQFEVNVHFRSNKVPRALPKDISLCLFRIMQEALHNALKYSGVREFEVDLRGTAQAVQLEVRDAGVGFEVDVAKRGAGLGLVSMQERVHVLHGQLRVESRPGAGTTVLASVPFIAANERSPGVVED
jgi:PAS domain S-box-containing protein